MTPLTARGQATRRRIVEAAAELMHSQGVSATSVDEVLARAGAGKSQLYHYFDDKEELVCAVLALQMQRAWTAPVVEGWDDLGEWLDGVVEHHRRRTFVGGCPVGTLAAEMVDSSERLRSELSSAFRTMRSSVRRALQALQSQGELDPEADTAGLATFVVATLQGGLLLARTDGEDAPLLDAVEHAWERLRSLATEARA